MKYYRYTLNVLNGFKYFALRWSRIINSIMDCDNEIWCKTNRILLTFVRKLSF